MYFCAHENIGKQKNFIKLKFILRLCNIFVHSCWHIYFIVLCGFDQKFKMNSNRFENGFGQGFKIKRKRK